LICIY